jgi:hypothetical protein
MMMPMKKMMNINKVINNITHDNFFAYLENKSARNLKNLAEENPSLYSSLLTNQLFNLYKDRKVPKELADYQKYTPKLEDFFNNHSKDILWLQLKSKKYPLLDSYISSNMHKVPENKEFCIFYTKYANLKEVEIKMLVESIYPELATNISTEFQKDFWCNLLIHQKLSKTLITRYLPVLNTPQLALLLHKYQPEFFKLDPISINRTIKLSKLG